MLHLRIVAPSERAELALALLSSNESCLNIIHLPGASRKPDGDVILCDVAREDASVILADLRELDIPRRGSIAIENVDLELSTQADEAERSAPGLPGDAVVWEEVEARTSENVELGASYLTFMTLAMLIAMVGIMLDSTVLIVGAMVVGPDFGPIAGLCVAAVERRPRLVAKSLTALLVGFAVGIGVTLVVALSMKWLSLPPGEFESGARRFTQFISDPDFFSFFVAYVAGTAGVLTLTTAKSGALVGVLISVTTIPAAANIGVALAYTDWDEAAGSIEQLAVNMTGIFTAGILTLMIQRRLYVRRRRRHLERRESQPTRAAPRTRVTPPPTA